MQKGKQIETPLGTGTVESAKNGTVTVKFSTPVWAEDRTGFWDFVHAATFDRSQCRAMVHPTPARFVLDFRDSPCGANKVNFKK